MTQAVARILEAAEQLSALERAEFIDRLVERVAQDIPPEIEAAQIAEVHRRMARVESGETTLIPGEEALAQARKIVSSARRAD